ncbi:MAG: acetoacetate decarboxylase family protein [Peptoniphilaceae bacterium]|nr:acetoacetate decarboxylase family protein [Peptoniphilaceae bacterium]MDY3738643.1 acetoacetate decarboxylase family protein [Peptoniphilaceae bacterium]
MDNSFLVKNEDIENFRKVTNMLDQEGIYLVYKTDKKVLEKIIPYPLEVSDIPLAFLSISNIKNPTFADRYYETILSVAVKYKNETGAYPISLLLGGFGSEMATYSGRDFGSMPKKLGAQFNFRKNNNDICVSVSRRGFQILNLKMKLGEYNNEIADKILGSPFEGKQRRSSSYFFYIDKIARQYKDNLKDQSSLIKSNSTMVYKSWEKGSIKLDINSSLDDPRGCVPIIEMLGGGYSNNDLLLNGGEWMEFVDASKVLPKILYSRYDKTVFNHLGRI